MCQEPYTGLPARCRRVLVTGDFPMSMQHLEHMCNILNYGVEGEQELTTPSNIGHWWDVDTAAVLALGPEWQFVNEDSYDPTDLPPPPAPWNTIITGNDGKCAWYFLLTRP